jgi:hypothetical protein
MPKTIIQQKAAPLGPLKIAAIVATVPIDIGAAAAGALLCIDKPIASVVLRLHQLLPVLVLLPIIGSLYLLPRDR